MYTPYERPPVKDVFLYIRQSTDEKAGKQVRSLDDQRHECQAMAAYMGLNIVEIFSEDKSAKYPNQRPVFKSMMKALSYKSPAKRRADGILSWHPNRLSRNALEAGMIVQMLDDELIKDMFFPAYSFHNDASGKEHLFIEFARSKGYSDHLSISVMRGNSSREREGAMIYCSKFGYRKKREVPENPKLCSLFPIPCEVNFPIVQRIFELRLQGQTLLQITNSLKNENLKPKTGTPLGKSRIGAILSDPFYHGSWTINKGKKNERIKDLLSMQAPDGTKFTPILSELQFLTCQSEQVKNKTMGKITRHTNPFPMAVTCHTCDHKMRPCWKKIKKAGGIIESQLGYECQTRINNKRCGQPRVKADILYAHIADAFQSVTMDKKTYQRFLIGSESFIRKKSAQLKTERIKQSKLISSLKRDKLSLLQQKAVLAMDGSLTAADKDLLDKEITELTARLQTAESRHRELAQDGKAQIMGFRKFIELSQKLHVDWLNADLAKKAKISEKLVLNLTLESRKIRSQTWSGAFDYWLNGPKFRFGTPYRTLIEPCVFHYWTAFSRYFNFWADFADGLDKGF